MKFIKIKLIIAFFITFNYSSAQLSLTPSSTLNTNCNGTDCSYDGPSILINEVVMSPFSGDGSLYGPGPSDAAAGEWIELYNPNLCLPVDISCYYLGNNAKDGDGIPKADCAGGFVFPPGTIVPPRGFLVVRGENAPAVPKNLLGTTPGKTIEIVVNNNANQVCIGTGSQRLWFPNAGGWFAFYDRNGVPQDAIYWCDSTDFNKDANPCVPAFPGCNFSGTLASFSGIPQARKTYIHNTVPPFPIVTTYSYRRIPDGGPWAFNQGDDTPSMGDCNNTTCNDPIISTCTGTATVNVMGGNGNYSYKWDDSFGQTTNPATKLCDDTYNVTVTDNDNNNTATTTVVVSNNTVTVTMKPSSQAICSGQSATITASGANASTYKWSQSTSSDSSITVSPTNSTNNYEVTITDIYGCTGSNKATITVNPIPVVTVADTIICLGDEATLHAYGANTYVWNDGPTGSPLVVTPSTLGDHTYTVTGTSNGCTGADDAVVYVKDCQIEVEIVGGTICEGGYFELNAVIKKGTAISYEWSPILPPTAGPHQVWPTSKTTYTVTVKNANGFSDTDTAVVMVNPNPVITFNPPNPTICAGTSVQISASGANTYVWSPSTGLNSTTGSTVTASPADTLTYTVTGTLNGCTGIGTVTVNVAPNPIIEATPVNTTCGNANGSVTVSTTSGTAPFHYSWNTNPNYDTTSVSNLSSDIYNIHVSDANGCTSNVTTTVGSSIPITIAGTIVDEVCSGDLNGSIDVTVEDATGSITYLWSNDSTTQDLNAIAGGSYTLTVTDGNKCEATKVFKVGTHPKLYASATSEPEYCGQKKGKAIAIPTGGTLPYIYSWDSNPAQNTAVASNLPADNYSVTVTDGFCSASASVPVNFVNGPTATVDSIIHASCELNNGEAYVQISEGTAPFNYTWSGGIIQTTSNITNVYAGTYILTVTDSKGCTDTAKAIINGSNIPTALITHTITAHCGYSNGAITVGVANGNGPYQYEWNTNPVQTDTVAKGVPAGTYIVTITDNTGCTTTVSGVVPQFPGPTVKLTSSPDICLQANGTATAKCNGGHGAPYTYLWNTGDTTGMITGLATGSYSVTISDGGCQASSTIEVPLINGPNADFMIHPIATTILESNIFFTDQTMGPIVNWSWTLGDGAVQNISEFSYNYQGPGVYPVSMVVVDTNNCVDTIRDTIIIRDIFTIYIPNSFTPNDDEFNDGFTPKGTYIDPEGFEMYIFDRWGNQMYYTTKWGDNQAAEPWNGTLNNTGNKDYIIFDTYVYKIIIKELNGPRHQYFGKITLIQ